LTFGVIGCKLSTQMSVESLPGKEQSERQRWEYRFLVRSRGIKGSVGAALGALAGTTRDYANATEWEDLETKVSYLGENGWELVNIIPRSSIAGSVGDGFTTDELWVFKRPKYNSLGQTQPSERVAEARTFSPEAREALEKKGYLVYPLQGKSMRLMWKQIGLPESVLTEMERESLGPLFWITTTQVMEVAINPNQLFIPNSNNKSFKGHQKMVALFSEEIADDIKGVKAIIGEATNYVELALLHREATGKSLFELNDKFVYVVTNTPYYNDRPNDYLVEVGGEGERGVIVSPYYLGTQGKMDTWLMPLVVPLK